MRKKEILRKKDDFQAIYKAGKSVPERYVVLFYRKNDLPYSRTAFLASKKVGNSIQRNRAKRLMKESYRLNADRFLDGYDLIFIARNTINGKKQKDVQKSLLNAAKRGKVTGR
ncbi:MAG: ribonuclease P protein component [Clostridiales bacterium]|jgi:ribonuclease P protein component|nr:ribonuclease P protein component [Clostridiales bacterium]